MPGVTGTAGGGSVWIASGRVQDQIADRVDERFARVPAGIRDEITIDHHLPCRRRARWARRVDGTCIDHVRQHDRVADHLPAGEQVGRGGQQP